MSSALPVKPVVSFFYLKRPSVAFNPSMSPPWTKCLPGLIWSLLFRHPTPSYHSSLRLWKRSFWIAWNGFGMSRLKHLTNNFDYSLLPPGPCSRSLMVFWNSLTHPTRTGLRLRFSTLIDATLRAGVVNSGIWFCWLITCVFVTVSLLDDMNCGV